MTDLSLQPSMQLQSARDVRGCKCPVDRPCICCEFMKEKYWMHNGRAMQLQEAARFWPCSTFRNWALPAMLDICIGEMLHGSAPWQMSNFWFAIIITSPFCVLVCVLINSCFFKPVAVQTR